MSNPPAPAPAPAAAPVAAAPPTVPPLAPLMGTVHETYSGSGVFNFKLGGKPKADWSGLDLSGDPTKENPMRFRPVNITKDKYISDREKPIKSRFASNVSTVEPLKELSDRAKAIGLDTYLYLPDPSDPTKMLSVIDNYPVFIADVDATKKIADDLKAKFDDNDLREDATLHTIVKSSCSKEIMDRLKFVLNEDTDSAALLLMQIMNRAVKSSSTYYDKVKAELKSLQPKMFAGENVESMGLKAQELIKILEGANRLNADDFQRYVANYAKVSCKTSVYYHNVAKLIGEFDEAVQSTIHLSQEKAWEELTRKGLDTRKVIDTVTRWYTREVNGNEWEAAKLPTTSQSPSSAFSQNLASDKGIVNKIVALLKLDPSTMEKHVSNGTAKSKPSGSKGNCHNCGSPDHWARDCPHPKKNASGSTSGASRKGRVTNRRHNSDNVKSWRTTAPAPGSSETTQRNGRTFYWCAKCRRWTASHGTSGHTGRPNNNSGEGSAPNDSSNGQSGANLLCVDPGAWCVFIDPPKPASSTKSFAPQLIPSFFSLLKVAFLGAISVGLVSILSSAYLHSASTALLSFTSSTFDWISTSSQAIVSHVQENLHEIYLPALAPMTWFLVGFGVAVSFLNSPPTKPFKRHVRRHHQKHFRRWKKKNARNRRHYGHSARSSGLHRSYPLRLRNQGVFRTRAPTFRQRKLHSSLHDFITANYRHHTCSKDRGVYSTQGDDAKKMNGSGCSPPQKHGRYGSRSAKKVHNKVNRGWKGDYFVNDPHNFPTRLSKKQVDAISTIANEVNLISLPDILRHDSNIPLVLRAAHQAPARFRNALGEDNFFPVIWDSGASVSITPNKKDFISYKSSDVSNLNGVGSGLEVKGEGMINWTFTDDNGNLRSLKVKAYHAPKSKVRLLSTQSLLQHYEGESIQIHPHELTLSGVADNPERASITIRVNENSNLPTSIAYRNTESTVPSAFLNTISTVHESNLNLSEPQKELLRWHYRLGHVDIRRVQFVMRQGLLATSPAKRRLHVLASKLKPTPKCAACQFGKQVRRTTPGIRTTTVPAGKISRDTLFPGQEVSVDHFVCSTKGRLWTSRGRTRESDLYHGGALFVDQASKYIHVENQVSLSTHATLHAKLAFEKVCSDVGVVVQKYLSDGGSCFTSKEFNQHLSVFRQIIRFAGAGAHHHNPSEREIRTIMSIARTMMLHASIHWPELSEPELWPMAVSYAVYTWNHLPNPDTGLSPSEIFTKSKWSYQNFQNFHVWGCPAYVLDKEIADGKKIPKWRPRSQRMMFVGFSPDHASCIPMVLNPLTGSITPQFHVVFDDWFDTVTTNVEDLPDYHSPQWYKLFGDSEFQYILDEDEASDDPPPSTSDVVHHDRFSALQERTASAMPPPQPLPVLPPPSLPLPSAPPLPTGPNLPQKPSWLRAPTGPPPLELGPPPLEFTDTKPPALPTPVPLRASVERESAPSFDDLIARQPTAQRESSSVQRESKPPRALEFNEDVAPILPPSAPSPSPSTVPPTPPSTPVPPPRPSPRKPSSPKRRSTRQRKAPKMYDPSAFMAEIPAQELFEASINYSGSDFNQPPEFWDDYSSDSNPSVFDELPTLHPFAYASNRQDPDIFSYDQVLGMKDRLKWYESAKTEIEALGKYDTWTEDLKSNVPEGTKIIPGTWVFKLKRAPDGTPTKYKARFCVRGDLQDITEDDTYAPLVSFPTVRLFLALTILFDWVTLSVDFDNAFVQAELEKPVWIHFPRGFGSKSGDTHTKCLKLRRSLYGMATAPVLFYNHLFGFLVDKLEFIPCKLDPCFLFRPDCMMIVYCDDVAFAAKDRSTIDKVITRLRELGLELTVEGTFEDYLSVKYARSEDGSVTMTQKGLIEKVLKAASMTKCTSTRTPANVEALASDVDGPPMEEEWNYRSIVGMLIYLSTNTRPDITFAVSQVARYGNDPKKSHAKAVKKILRYLRGTSEFGITFKPSDLSAFQIDLHVDADFAGRHNADLLSDRNSARSRTGYIITLNGCPVIWKSALQTSISQSTGESEYCALSEGLRQALPIRSDLCQLRDIVSVPKAFAGEVGPIRAWEDNSAALSLANNHRLTARNRWYNVKYHFFWEHVDNGTVVVKKVESEKQHADYLTKGLNREMFQACRKLNQGW